jgi:N-acetylglucosaminyl-diphospho-decaprenol L-rhamnosyltransferase
MSISRQNLSIVIVTLKSEKVIYDCLKSINETIPIIIVENSNNQKFKSDVESKYTNVRCILSNSNLGMGAGNNIGIKECKTDYVFIINPDVILETDTIDQLIESSKYINDFSIIAPITSDTKYPNYKILKKSNLKEKNLPFKVDYVDGFAMLLNKKKFTNDLYFDENFFLYLENNDLCLRVSNKGGSILIIPNAKITHGGSKAVDPIFKSEVELSRNWHWMWSKFYFNKKNFGFFRAIIECFPSYISSIFKFIFYSFTNNQSKKKICFNRISGFYNALLNKPSWYRPKIND